MNRTSVFNETDHHAFSPSDLDILFEEQLQSHTRPGSDWLAHKERGNGRWRTGFEIIPDKRPACINSSKTLSSWRSCVIEYGYRFDCDRVITIIVHG